MVFIDFNRMGICRQVQESDAGIQNATCFSFMVDRIGRIAFFC